jgi:F-type H+-transporting ATPase subunit gamma
MASRRDIKRRITSVKNTKKITKAMEMVAAARLRKAQQRIESTRPYAIRMMEFMAGIARYIEVDSAQYPLLKEHDEIRRVALVALTADRGLCGAFNTNVVRRTQERMRSLQADGKETELLAVGKKGVGTFRFQDYELTRTWVGVTDKPTFLDAQAMAHKLAEMYVNEEVDEVLLVYNHFKSAMEQRTTEQVILPVKGALPEEAEEEDFFGHVDFLFEPGAAAILNSLLPRYLEMAVYRALLESTASEHGARMTAMRNASEAAGEMIDVLTLQMNRVRQASITREILEVVAGADALS